MASGQVCRKYLGGQVLNLCFKTIAMRIVVFRY